MCRNLFGSRRPVGVSCLLPGPSLFPARVRSLLHVAAGAVLITSAIYMPGYYRVVRRRLGYCLGT